MPASMSREKNVPIGKKKESNSLLIIVKMSEIHFFKWATKV